MDNKRFIMNGAGIIVTNICNLKCKLCVAFSPYTEYKSHFKIDLLKDSIDKYFEIVDFVKIFTISGGEPLLNKDLTNFINYIKKYNNNIGRLEIITNGTILPSDELLKSIKQYGENFVIYVDNYGKKLSKKYNLIIEKLDEYKIKNITRDYCSENPYCGGWVDFGDMKTLKHSFTDSQVLFSKCVYVKKNFCFSINDGKMFPCPMSTRFYQLGLMSNKTEYLDLFDDNLSLNQKRDQIEQIYNSKGFLACQYCNGFSEDSARYYPAEQL